MKKSSPDRLQFETIDGIKIKFNLISWSEYQLARAKLMAEYRDRGDQIDCPTYTVKFASGNQQEFPHDTKSILSPPPDTAPEDVDTIIEQQKATWDAYMETIKAFGGDDNILLADMIYEDGLNTLQLPEDEGWMKKQIRRKLTIPTDPEERRRHYINTVVLKSAGDQLDLCAQIVGASSGIAEDDLQSVMIGFRSSLWSKSKASGKRNPAGEVAVPTPGGLDGK
jgi:hypothetical protein